MFQSTTIKTFPVQDYNLDATLDSGQAFRWRYGDGAWTGVVGKYWLRLRSDRFSITAETAEPVSDWSWLTNYLQVDLNLTEVLNRFPADQPLAAAVEACRGLRLLRQDPWECLASFICSSTKQIVQIKQILSCICERYGEAIPARSGQAFTFPLPGRLAAVPEAELRACKLGFRAPYLRETALRVASGQFMLERPASLTLDLARQELMRLPGVGRKVADCVLLFAYGFPTAFPIDVWVFKAMRKLYFRGRNVRPQRIQTFVAGHFGEQAGYAQQYLFHHIRKQAGRVKPANS